MSVTASTSRVGRKPVAIPSGVDIKLDREYLAVKGPKGNVRLSINSHTQVLIEEGQVKILLNKGKDTYSRSGTGAKLLKSIPGTLRSEIYNAVIGVTKGFERKLVLVGVGYRAQAKGKVLGLTIGFSHPVDFSIPEGITIETPSQTEIIVKGTNKHLVGHTASMIRDIRSPEPYKGKGIRYMDEVISLKETKKK
jgi:large subunit ribosomal protein L6